MECIEAIALKSSFLLKTVNTNVLYNDDVWCLTGINGGGGAAASVADDFPVEDLLNLDFPEIEFQEENNGLSKGNSNIPSSSSSSFFGSDEFDCPFAGELTVPGWILLHRWCGEVWCGADEILHRGRLGRQRRRRRQALPGGVAVGAGGAADGSV